MNIHSKGFTLIELLVAVFVMSIAIGFTIPAFKKILDKSHTTSASNDILMVMHHARAQALRTRTPVVVCPTINGESCSGSNWSKTISGLDKNRDGNLNGSETILKYVQLSDRIKTSTLGEERIIFLPDGTARMGDMSDEGIDDPDAIAVCAIHSKDFANVIRVGFSSAQTEIVKGDSDLCS